MAEISTVAMAKYLNLSTAELRKLELSGVVKRSGHNRWNPTSCVHAYLKWLQTCLAEMQASDTVLSQPQAAAVLGVTTRRLRQRSQEETPPPQDVSGRYPCRAFGKWMLDDFRRGLGVGDDGTIYDYDGERARLTHHQANVASLDEQERQRKLIPAEIVLCAWTERVASARAKLLSLPSRMASACAGRSALEVESEARSIVYEALHELSSGSDALPGT